MTLRKTAALRVLGVLVLPALVAGATVVGPAVADHSPPLSCESPPLESASPPLGSESAPVGSESPPVGCPPGAPQDVVAAPGHSSAAVSWSPPETHGLELTGYTVTSSPDGRTCSVGEAAASTLTSCTVRGLVAGTSYSFTVTATTHGGTSAPSAAASARPTGCFGTRFSDVAGTHGFCAAIGWMAQNRISSGTALPDGSVEYRPVAPVSRAAMAPFLYRVLGSPAFSPPSSPSFADVGTSHPFFKEIEWLRAAGISKGTAQPVGLPLYKPADAVSRQAMAPFLYRAAGSPAFTPPQKPSFADVATSHVFFKEIEWLAAAGISTGTAQPSGLPLYKPSDAVSRQAMAAFLNRFATAS